MTDLPTEVPPAPPRRRRVAPADAVCAAGLAFGIVATYALAALTPSMLAHHVVLLEALAGSSVSIVTGGALARVGQAALPAVVLAPLCGVLLYDVFVWWAGRRWGNRLAEVYTRRRPRAARFVARAEALVRRRGVWALAVAYYLPVPNPLLYLACGTSGMSLPAFLLGDVLGTLLWEALLVALGWAAGHEAVGVVTAVDRHATEVTLALVAGWLLVRFVLRARQRPASGAGTA